MTGTGQSHLIDWRDGRVPVSRQFDDPFYSLEDGWAESTHVFLNGNDLPVRFRDGFQVAELGFGTGLNAALVLTAWKGPGRIGFTSFEAFPMHEDAAREALQPFPDAKGAVDIVTQLLRTGAAQAEFADLRLVTGDARATVPAWDGMADAWFLDGFSPAKNPEMWQPGLMSAVGAHTARDGTFATYTAAGHVRRGLDAAGFDVERVPGYGRKRHMSRGRKR